MKRIAFISSAAASLIFAAATLTATAQTAAKAQIGDARAGAQIVQRCQGCHGIAGWRTAFPEVYNVPKIAGQHTTYFVSALKAYKTGDRKHPGMRAIAVSLSDGEINNLAAYYADAKQ